MYDGEGSFAQRWAFIQRDVTNFIAQLVSSDVADAARARLVELYERRQRDFEENAMNTEAMTIADATEKLRWDGSPYGGDVKGYIPYFAYEHLPAFLQPISKPFGDLAASVMARAMGLGPHAIGQRRQALAALQRLVEAKDAAVRAAIAPKS